MPVLEKGVQMMTNRMPKVVSPRAHAIIDYALAASFAVAGARSWRGSKKAAISAFIIAGAELGVAMITDYPGGVAGLISFPAHGTIDAGMSGLIASMPNLMGFGDERQAWFFRVQAMSMAAVTGLTDFEYERHGTGRYRAHEAA
jgi:hypothetical protein